MNECSIGKPVWAGSRAWSVIVNWWWSPLDLRWWLHSLLYVELSPDSLVLQLIVQFLYVILVNTGFRWGDEWFNWKILTLRILLTVNTVKSLFYMLGYLWTEVAGWNSTSGIFCCVNKYITLLAIKNLWYWVCSCKWQHVIYIYKVHLILPEIQ
jgi:hypothetical protein